MSEDTETRKERRIAILGTAPTWRETPWDDPTLEVWCLNDAHVLNIPRADRWYDLHPFEQMFFRDVNKPLRQTDIPVGSFVRPKGHLDWLRKQTIPVYVQDAKALGSPNARTFPKAEIERAFGPYFASSPAWMVGHALLEGVTELHIYGIHLATEWEYLKQKPNMTFLLGLAAGRGVTLVLPKGSPLLKESHQYAYDLDPDLPKLYKKREIEGYHEQLALVEKQIQSRKWYQRRDPNLASRKAWLQAQIADGQYGLQTIVAGRPVGA